MTTVRSDILSFVNTDLSRNRLFEAAQLLEDLHPAEAGGFLEALDEDDKQKPFRQLDTDTASKETRVGLLMVLACGLILGVAAEVWQWNSALGLTVGVSMTMVIYGCVLNGQPDSGDFSAIGYSPGGVFWAVR